jgi:nucleotide-binding universal stress UspA family protein
MYSRILVPIDGSDSSARACAEAIKLGVDQKARLRLLHVVSYGYISAVLQGNLGDVLRRIRAEGQSILGEAERTASAAGLEVEPRLLEHESTQIGEAIVEDAKKWRADLVVMGTHGRRGFVRSGLGSDAEYVARHARTPVMLVRMGTESTSSE